MRKPEPDLRTRALKYLARREYSRSELYRKLAPHTADAGALESLLNDLSLRGLLSEERFVEQMVHARKGKYGSLRIARELREKGVAGELVDAAVAGMKDGELEMARAVWLKKFGRLPATAAERAKQARFLHGRGFGAEVIHQVLRNPK